MNNSLNWEKVFCQNPVSWSKSEKVKKVEFVIWVEENIVQRPLHPKNFGKNLDGVQSSVKRQFHENVFYRWLHPITFDGSEPTPFEFRYFFKNKFNEEGS